MSAAPDAADDLGVSTGEDVGDGAGPAAAAPPGEDAPGYVVGGDKDALLSRLRRIEGQVRGVHRMVESDTYCVDVLTQVTAIKRALEKVSLLLVEDHLRGCVLEAARAGDPGEAEAHLAEASSAIGRLLRS